MNRHHREILSIIKDASVTPTQHTFSDAYLGNTNPRYAVDAPTLRKIAKEWMAEYRELPVEEFTALLDSLIKGKSSTEKFVAGMLMDCARPAQQTFDPKIFDQWLEHLSGWAEVDVVCTGKYTIKAIGLQPDKWSRLLKKFSTSKNLSKRRASLAFLCLPIRYHKSDVLLETAFDNIDRLKHEKEILITKAISWLLRSMVTLYKKEVKEYVQENKTTLPSIAVRETLRKLETGKKT